MPLKNLHVLMERLTLIIAKMYPPDVVSLVALAIGFFDTESLKVVPSITTVENPMKIFLVLSLAVFC